MRIYNAIFEKFPHAAGPRTVWTVGKITLEPGRRVSCQVMNALKFRDDDEAFSTASMNCSEISSQQKTKTAHVRCHFLYKGVVFPALMDDKLQNLIEQAAEHAAPGQHIRCLMELVMTLGQFLKSCRRR